MADRKEPTFEYSVDDNAVEDPNRVYYRMAGKKRFAHGSWYRGENTNFHPRRSSLLEENAIEDHIGKGWFPKNPFIGREHYITAFGSCFAAEVTKFLIAENYRVFGGDLDLNSHIVRSGEGIVSSAALAQQFEWAYGLSEPSQSTWHTKAGETAEASDDVKSETLKIFQQTDVFILTLGLSEVWTHRRSGEVYWRAIPRQEFDPEQHEFKVLSAQENYLNLLKIYRTIRQNRPDSRIILTLSPVPLVATFRPISCVTANSVSKASLRIAIDELMREHSADGKLHYFPSYEMMMHFIENAFGDDLRHPRRDSVRTVMRTFQKHYLY